VPRLRDGGDAADGVGRRRSDQLWMGTIQEAVTCGRFDNGNRRQETGSAPHRDVMAGSLMHVSTDLFTTTRQATAMPLTQENEFNIQSR
jgi:hypothetical protein